jgi:GNAT superfamily N-acetyltransferase
MVTTRPAVEDDVPVITAMIRELAEYERLLHELDATEDDYRRHLFGERPSAEVVLAEMNGRVIGYALFFTNFSTFRGRPGIYLEDLYVSPAERGQGAGKALLRHLARLALERECARLEWVVLDWNQPAIDFYVSLGAKPTSDWTTYRVTGPALEALGAP